VLPDQAAEMRRIASSLGLAGEFDHARPTHVNGGGSGRAHRSSRGSHSRRRSGSRGRR
jgi:hypothetical protein